MDSSDLFGGGFGAASQQPFAFDGEDMNPFGDSSSPWNDAPQPAAKHGSASASASDSDSDSDSDGKGGKGADGISEAHSGRGSDDGDSLHQAAADKLRIAAAAADNAAASSDKDGGAAGPDAAPGPAVDPLAGLPGPAVSTARRVGVIKRGLRSPRVLGKKLSPASLEDPLSSAAAADPLAATAPALLARASMDAGPAARAQQARQTRSMSEARSSGGSSQAGGSPLPPLPPHPYDQQLSPPLQREQEVTARHHIETGSQPSPARRPSVAAPGPSQRPTAAAAAAAAAQRACLGGHQRRRSLDPTPADQIPPMHIQVTDPVKVSDSLKPYIAYRVRTQTSAPMFREGDMTVRRRYRDFDWLVQELVARHPGVVVPAIPEKQSMGRFEDEFVEARRAGLESCLARIARHPVLWNDDVFRMFLAVDDFAAKARTVTDARVAAEINGTAPLLSGGGGGGPGGGGSGTGAAGLFGDAWGATRYKEKDEWFARRMQELDATEEELRALQRALEHSRRQRRDLSLAHGELAEAYLQMAGQELSQSLGNALTDMGSLQQKLKALQGRQGAGDFAAFQLTTDEYIRMIGAARTAFAVRGRAHGLWQASLAELLKKRRALEGHVQNPGRAAPERVSQLRAEITRAEMRTEASRNAFDDVSQLLRHELARFDAARVRDFQAAIESYLASLIDTQEEIVTLWDAYLTSLHNTDPAAEGRASA
ncbi:Vacuolar protein sorting-associated protein vps5 [Coemansia javaensis]|uniref:Vacuolar protein sorting-associated protein vps5 n=1 Tax=Coemansia javaensis TaxID=2761396 RepID=A0A9W8HG25_9FUNG|nr:Vacuolar protein sorting-associated protein vps5 [Coemansia javaensis]